MSTSPIVILVESDPLLSSILRAEFARLDFAVLLARDSKEAEEYSAQTVANLVVLTDGRPERNGYQACVRIRRRRGYANRPIILTANDISSEDKAAAEKAGVTVLLPRPYSVSDLILAITPHVPAGDPLITHRPRPSGMAEPMMRDWKGLLNPTPWFGLDPMAVAVQRGPSGSSQDKAPMPRSKGVAQTRRASKRADQIALHSNEGKRREVSDASDALMHEDLKRRRELEQDLGCAVKHRQLQLLYQPLVSCFTGEVEGFEALLRWHHPQRGMVPPLEFIPLAEATGLIVEIGQWVIETACEEAAGWNEPYRVAVNISPIQVRQPDLTGTISDILARTGLPANRLELELTEGILVEHSKLTARTLSALRELGVAMVIDDFGTGYSGLSYLHAFEFDKLKIDRSFITKLGGTEDARIIVRSMIRLAHDLGLSIVGEGVETVEQLNYLRDLGCDQVQGYLFGRPAQMDSSNNPMVTSAKMLLGGA
jgi:EAL domain-containing protein (putative c-di-GMP-specific phosphodiesterase class I)/CheY-like chemotaxis protein